MISLLIRIKSFKVKINFLMNKICYEYNIIKEVYCTI